MKRTIIITAALISIVAIGIAVFALREPSTAAERRVMEESAISEQNRALWCLLSAEGIPVKEAAKRLGIPANTASKIKRRMEARIFALVQMYEKEIGKGLA